MKHVKSLALGALALATVASSQATTVKITGSSAFRKSLYAAVVNQLSAGGTKTVNVAFAGNSDINKAAQATFTTGTDAAGGDTVQCCFAGSVGGVSWVAQGLTASTDAGRSAAKVATAFIKQSAATGTVTVGTAAGSAVAATGGYLSSLTAGTNAESGVAEMAMSDSFQSSTPYAAANGYSELSIAGDDANGVGVVLFVFAKGKASLITSEQDARFKNVTALGFQTLAANGKAALSFFTGNAGDASTTVYLVGRDNDSGTRLAAAFETGFGDVNAAFKQYSHDGTTFADIGASATISTLYVPNTNTALGYSSGGKIKNLLDASLNTAGLTIGTKTGVKNAILLSYVGTGDIPTDANQILAYNGVRLYDSANAQVPDLVKEGQYSFWTYEQAYFKTSDAAKQTLINAIANDIHDIYATSSGGLFIGDMLVARSVEGGVIN